MTSRRHDQDWLEVCAFAAAKFSTCAKRQYFAVVLDAEGRVIGAGYNGSPPGMGHCTDGFCPRMQEGSAPGSSYDNCISIHAEENALLFSDRSARRGGTLIINGTPCWGCGKKLAGSGLGRVVYYRDPSYADLGKVEGLLQTCGIVTSGVALPA